jgi:hypothetical protein
MRAVKIEHTNPVASNVRPAAALKAELATMPCVINCPLNNLPVLLKMHRDLHFQENRAYQGFPIRPPCNIPKHGLF